MRVLVTGGAGYIGSELVFQLAKIPDVEEIIVYDNLSKANYNLFISHSNKIDRKNVKFVMGDLLDTRKLQKALKGIDVVYHLAAKVTNPYNGADSDIFEQVNHWGTAELTYAVEEAGVKQLIHLSSAGVYGFSPKKQEITEDSRLNPRTFYSISKMRAEGHALRLKDKMNVVVFRAANVYGYTPVIRFDAVINKFLFDSHFNGQISIHGSGKQVRPFIHVKNLVKALLVPLKTEVESDVYNLIQRNTSILDLVDIYKALYPELEFIFINQHLELRDLKISLSSKFDQYLKIEEGNLKAEIEEAKEEAFAF